MTGENRDRVLVVDDHDRFRIGLCARLDEEGFEVTGSGGGEPAVRRAATWRPDVVVMDMGMPGTSGIEAMPLVLHAAPRASVLMLTIATDEPRMLDAIRAGASGCLVKDAGLDGILAGVRAAAAGHSAIAPELAGALLHSIRSHRPQAPTGSPSRVLELSPRERRVLELVTAGHDNAEIAGRLFLSESTVKHNLSRLLVKLGVKNRVQAATFAVSHGWQ